MNQEWLARQTASPESRRHYEQERLVLWVAEMISEAMEKADVSRDDLARTLGTSPASLTALLGGERDLTVGTLADVASVLGHRVEITLQPLGRVGCKT